jgi:hypothetical protein
MARRAKTRREGSHPAAAPKKGIRMNTVSPPVQDVKPASRGPRARYCVQCGAPCRKWTLVLLPPPLSTPAVCRFVFAPLCGRCRKAVGKRAEARACLLAVVLYDERLAQAGSLPPGPAFSLAQVLARTAGGSR